MREYINVIRTLPESELIKKLKNRMLDEERYVSMEQALLITESYKENEKNQGLSKGLLHSKRLF